MNKDLYKTLVATASSEKATITYSEVAQLLNLSMRHTEDRQKLAGLLDEISRSEHEQGRPMLSAVVVHKDGNQMPGSGFFDLAQKLNLLNSRSTNSELTFWVEELKSVRNHWKASKTKH